MIIRAENNQRGYWGRYPFYDIKNILKTNMAKILKKDFFSEKYGII